MNGLIPLSLAIANAESLVRYFEAKDLADAVAAGYVARINETPLLASARNNLAYLRDLQRNVIAAGRIEETAGA